MTEALRLQLGLGVQEGLSLDSHVGEDLSWRAQEIRREPKHNKEETMTEWRVLVGLTIKQEEIWTAGIHGVQKQINCECLTKEQDPAERGAAADSSSGVNNRIGFAWAILHLNFSWFPRGNFWQCQSCHRQKCSPTETPSRRPAPPSPASLSSQSEESLWCPTSLRTGTPSGLFVLTPKTSSSPLTPKQVGYSHSCMLIQ